MADADLTALAPVNAWVLPIDGIACALSCSKFSRLLRCCPTHAQSPFVATGRIRVILPLNAMPYERPEGRGPARAFAPRFGPGGCAGAGIPRPSDN
jgi:hypothetical protein